MEIKTTIGNIVVTESIDPNNPGVYIDLKKTGADYALNLAVVECQCREDGPARLVTHVWGDASQEDTTHDIEHRNIEAYFAKEEE